MSQFLFVLCPPYSGSTALWQILCTSPAISALPKEGQSLEGVREVMRKDPYNEAIEFPWTSIRQAWESVWDLDSPILLEKSPPNLVRALEIERVFEPCHFIAMVRDPYAACEGISRRDHMSLENSARFWIKCAEHQIRNIEGLKRILFFTYEDLCDNTQSVREQVLDFIPELQSIHTEFAVRVHSVLGKKRPRKLQNLNSAKINNLNEEQIGTINTILENHRDVLEYFNYRTINPSLGRRISRVSAIPYFRMKKLYENL